MFTKFINFFFSPKNNQLKEVVDLEHRFSFNKKYYSVEIILISGEKVHIMLNEEDLNKHVLKAKRNSDLL